MTKPIHHHKDYYAPEEKLYVATDCIIFGFDEGVLQLEFAISELQQFPATLFTPKIQASLHHLLKRNSLFLRAPFD